MNTDVTNCLAAPSEDERLAALRSYEVLDTKSEQAFDDLTSLIAQICDTPIALVSLVDADRQWFKSRHGLDATETPREHAFCDHTIRTIGTMVVEDACRDDRFADSPLVTGDPNIRFYAGARLVDTDGHALGSLCVIDRQPRKLSSEQRMALETLSRQVVHLLELRRSHQRLAKNLQRVRNITDMIPLCGHCHAVRDHADEWQCLEEYFLHAQGTQFTHGVCPQCMAQHYGALTKARPRYR